MYIEDFVFSTDDDGIEFVMCVENRTKTGQAGLPKKRRVVQPKMFATGGKRCPGKLLKIFLERRPKEMRNSASFYLAVNERPKTQVWYKRHRMGVNSINFFMKTMEIQKAHKPQCSQNRGEEAESCKPTSACNYGGDRTYQREVSC